jgi:hypothetical protein
MNVDFVVNLISAATFVVIVPIFVWIVYQNFKL